MLIPFGVFSAAGAGGGGGGGAYELISTATGTGSSGTISFSSVPSTYKHLQIRWVANLTTSSDTLFAHFNTDTASIKPFHRLSGNGSSVTSSGFTNQTKIHMESISSTPSSWQSSGVMDVLDYASTSKYKTVKMLLSDPNAIIILKSALWQDTSAINAITLTSGQNFATTSRFSLYGIKG